MIKIADFLVVLLLMKKTLIISFLLASTTFCKAQKDFITLPILEKNFGKYEATFIDNDGQSALVFKNKKQILIYPFTLDGEVGELIKAQIPDSYMQSTLHAHVYDQGNYVFYFSRSKNKDFTALVVDSNTGHAVTKNLGISLGKEKFIETFSSRGRFYILSLVKNEWTLNLYEVGTNQKSEVSNFDFEEINLEYALFSYGIGGQARFRLIPQDAPVNLNITNVDTKIYYNSDSLTFTFEDNYETIFKSINLDTKKLSKSILEYESFDKGNTFPQFNTFIKNNLIYAGISNSRRMFFYIKDLSNGKVLSKFEFSRDEPIPFASTGIVQEGGSSFYSPATRDLSKTKQLLRKIYSSALAISVTENTTNTLELTIGSYKEVQQVNSGMGYGMPVGSFGGGATVFVNPYAFGYGSSTLTKSAFFSSVLDGETLDHLPEKKAGQSPWKRIYEYEKSIKLVRYLKPSSSPSANKPGAQQVKPITYQPKVISVYKLKDKYLFGYYDSPSREYRIKSFELED